METLRKPLQGVTNIVRFNWPFYGITILLVLLLVVVFITTNGLLQVMAAVLAVSVSAAVFVSLLVSFYVYDFSNLYTLEWLLETPPEYAHLLNVNAGFDEFTVQLQNKFPGCTIATCDFFNEQHHAGPSIRRARSAYPPPVAMQYVDAQKLPYANGYFDYIFLLFAAHEIRNEAQRMAFFKELNRVLKLGGALIISEHLRNLPNFLAYNIGFLHFYSHNSWNRTFADAGFYVEKKIRITPFVTTYFLRNHGNAN